MVKSKHSQNIARMHDFSPEMKFLKKQKKKLGLHDFSPEKKFLKKTKKNWDDKSLGSQMLYLIICLQV
jgi:hypothetical protein